MAASIDHSAQATSSPQSFTINNAEAILVCCFGSASGITSPTYGGVALTLLVKEDNSGNSGGVAEIWYLSNPTVGTANVAFTGVGAVGTHEVLGVAAAGNTLTGFSNVGGNPSVSITPLSSKGIYFTVAAADGSGASATIVPQNGQTQVLGTTGAPAKGSGYLIFSVGTAQTLSYNIFNFTTGGNSSLAAAEFRSGTFFTKADAVTGVDTITAKRGAIFSVLDTVTSVEGLKQALRGAIFTILNTTTTIDIVTTLRMMWDRSSKDATAQSNVSKSTTSSWTDSTKDATAQTNQPKTPFI